MKKPRIDEQAVVADGAVVLGDVTIEKDVSIWYNAVIRGDVNSISIGEGTNIQDLAVLHVDADATTVEEARDSILAALVQANSPLLNKGGAEK